MMYYTTPGYCVAKIPKAYSCAIAAAIAKTHYPDIYDSLQLTPSLCRAVIPQSETPQGTVYAVVRDPVERFISTCAMFNLSVEDGLLSNDEHFIEQSRFITPDTVVCKDLEELESHTGLATPVVNSGLNQKPSVTEKQIRAIKAKYESDVYHYN